MAERTDEHGGADKPPLKKRSIWSYRALEKGGLIIVGVVCLLLGCIFWLLAARVPAPVIHESLEEAGKSLFLAGLLSLIVEPITRGRHQVKMRDAARRRRVQARQKEKSEKELLDKIGDAHSEGILKGLMPQKVFEQVQQQVIRQPFVRKNLTAIYQLTWNPEHSAIIEDLTVDYDVENRSLADARYQIAAYAERKHEDRGTVGIISVEVSSPVGIRLTPEGAPKPSLLKFELGNTLNDYIEKPGTKEAVEAKIPIWLLPGPAAHVTLKLKSTLDSRDMQDLLAFVSTEGMDLTVVYPADLAVHGTWKHPIRDNPPLPTEQNGIKRWISRDAFLPFQGMQLSWEPVPAGST